MNWAQPRYGVTYPNADNSLAAGLAELMRGVGGGIGAIGATSLGEVSGFKDWITQQAIRRKLSDMQQTEEAKTAVAQHIRNLTGREVQFPDQQEQVPTQGANLKFEAPQPGEESTTFAKGSSGQATGLAPYQPSGSTLSPQAIQLLQEKGLITRNKPSPYNQYLKGMKWLPEEESKIRQQAMREEPAMERIPAMLQATEHRISSQMTNAELNRQAAQHRTDTQVAGRRDVAGMQIAGRKDISKDVVDARREATAVRKAYLTGRLKIDQQQADEMERKDKALEALTQQLRNIQSYEATTTAAYDVGRLAVEISRLSETIIKDAQTARYETLRAITPQLTGLRPQELRLLPQIYEYMITGKLPDPNVQGAISQSGHSLQYYIGVLQDALSGATGGLIPESTPQAPQQPPQVPQTPQVPPQGGLQQQLQDMRGRLPQAQFPQGSPQGFRGAPQQPPQMAPSSPQVTPPQVPPQVPQQAPQSPPIQAPQIGIPPIKQLEPRPDTSKLSNIDAIRAIEEWWKRNVGPLPEELNIGP